MSYWLREAAGWVLLILGLVVFGLVYDLLLRRWVIEAGPLAFVGFVIFRGGLHLLKVAMAAKAARDQPVPPAPLKQPRPLPSPSPRVTQTDVRRAMPGPKS